MRGLSGVVVVVGLCAAASASHGLNPRQNFTAALSLKTTSPPKAAASTSHEAKSTVAPPTAFVDWDHLFPITHHELGIVRNATNTTNATHISQVLNANSTNSTGINHSNGTSVSSGNATAADGTAVHGAPHHATNATSPHVQHANTSTVVNSSHVNKGTSINATTSVTAHLSGHHTTTNSSGYNATNSPVVLLNTTNTSSHVIGGNNNTWTPINATKQKTNATGNATDVIQVHSTVLNSTKATTAVPHPTTHSFRTTSAPRTTASPTTTRPHAATTGAPTTTVPRTTVVVVPVTTTAVVQVASVVHASDVSAKKEASFNQMYTTAFVIVGCVAAACVLALVVLVVRRRNAWVPHAVPTTPPASDKDNFPPAPTPVNFNTEIVIA
ncbi:hypothetical protein DYB35_005105 [Aphanomyces astaci]|uniref:Uncharacterized protein n=1 Tax=Aphanomyces astaci TaxID=112090 RepID=A0A3R6Y1J4_APHAT|nr:hypothetical protein DYB35_005105 [Aphanomyces astaci]